MTCALPFTSAIATLAHWPCRTLSPGELSVQTTLPVFLLKQTIAGALRRGDVLVRVVDAVAGDDVDADRL